MIELYVPGDPKPEKKRQRVFRKGDRTAMGSRTDEHEQKDFKARLAFFAAQAFTQPLAGPIRLTLVVRRPQPASYPKRPTKTKPWPWACMTRPDRTNYEKIIEDALNGIAWLDDAQIIDGVTLKRFGAPGVTIRVEELQAEDDALTLEVA